MQFTHLVVIAFYFAVPAAAGATAAWRARRAGSPKPLLAFALSVVSAAVIGTSLNLLYAVFTGARAQVVQVLLTSYLLLGVLCLLKAFNWAMKDGFDRLFRLRRPAVGPHVPHGWGWVVRATGATFLRGLLLAGLGLPYVMSVAMVYRPKVVGGDDPKAQLRAAFEPVAFAATDGTRLAGWWIPAARHAGPATRPADWGAKTAVLCHGLGANKSNQLALARELPSNGYNVLAFDFRAHGESGGQLSSFGDLERRDVLGAVRWARATHPAETRHLVGLGVSMGAAALLSAAADDGPEGRAIDAVAVYSTYDAFAGLADYVTGNFPVPGVGWLTRHVGVPLASLHAGTDLAGFSPAAGLERLAPRPLLVIHGRGDKIIPFDTGARLFEAASQPKLRLWVGTLDPETGTYRDQSNQPADHTSLMYNDDAAKAVLLFFEEGRAFL